MFKSSSPSFLLVCFFLLLLTTSCMRKASTYVYKSDGNNFDFPEKHLNLKSTGVCFSGGGTRAMTCAAGQMKALDSLDLWKDIGYISSVSGGSWASSVFTFYRPTAQGPKNDRELLGTPLGAKKLSLANLQQPIPKTNMTYAVTRDFTGKILENLLLDDFSLGFLESPHDIWIDAVGATYLEPFGIYGGKDRYFTLDQASMNRIIKREKKLRLSAEDFYLVHHQPGDAKRPYLVMNSSVLAPTELLKLPEPEQMTVFNYTPLSVGSAKFHKITIDKSGQLYTYPSGGGFIEPFAMGGTAPLSPPKLCGDNKYCADIKVDISNRFRLADAAGTSSAAFAAIVAEKFDAELLTRLLAMGSIDPEEHYWPVGASDKPAQKYSFADGGSLENFGVISLLQRQVKKIVVFVNTNTPIDTTFIPGKMRPNVNTIDYDFFTLFADYTYENHFQNNVFSEADFINVYNQFKKCIKNGTTVMAKAKTKTQANSWWGIPADQKVEILWVYNYEVPAWTKDLSSDIRAEIKKGKDGMFPHFPWYKTAFPVEIPFIVRLTPAMAKLLYELQFYNVFENREAFDFLRG